jgi:hypothetical protein
MKLGMFSMDSRGIVKMVPLSGDELHSFVPTLEQLLPDVQEIDPPYEYVRVDHLVWVDTKNIDGGVAMVLPTLVSDAVAKSGLSTAWCKWMQNNEELKALTRKVEEMTEELHERRAHLRSLSERPLNLKDGYFKRVR